MTPYEIRKLELEGFFNDTTTIIISMGQNCRNKKKQDKFEIQVRELNAKLRSTLPD